MAGIGFDERENGQWIVQGWIFRQLMADVRRSGRISGALARELDEAAHLNFIEFELLPPEVRKEASAELSKVAAGLLDGVILPTPGILDSDEKARVIYREALRELVDGLNRQA